MQDVTDLNFMRTVANFGAPDVFVTEYLRVHKDSRLEERILAPMLAQDLSTPVCLQLIGEDLPHIARIIKDALKHPEIKYLDLNLGCPAPKVYRKNVGGALLKDRKKIGEILRLMRAEWPHVLSTKMRTGFADASQFDDLVKCVCDCGVDFITLHARTVKQLYRPSADHSYTKRAVVLAGDIPVVANGDITSAFVAKKNLEDTNCAGLMMGRSAMRNPWIFRQTRELLVEHKSPSQIFRPTFADVRKYVDSILENSQKYNPKVGNLAGRLKKFLNFIATSIDPDGAFLLQMRRTQSLDELLKVCDTHLIENGRANTLMSDEPFDALCARPNHE